MKTSDFSFDLPAHLIAQQPSGQRGQSRLMVVDRQTSSYTHRMVHELPEILTNPPFTTPEGPPLLICNNSKVRKARLIGKSVQTGSRVEFLLLSPIPGHAFCWKALIQRARRRKIGNVYAFFDLSGAQAAQAEITGKEDGLHIIRFDRPVDDAWLDCYGHTPLPPYIKRNDTPDDADRYQTVYARNYGSCAAPTAGLHFTDELLDRLAAVGITIAYITLHVGLGTFLPVRTETIEDHAMHEETFSIDKENALKIETAQTLGKKIIAVGTTSVRTLESAWDSGLKMREGSTSIFIYPGYQFKTVDALFTNFHTPESTLIMLVAAFAGRELIMKSYTGAIQEGYRFFSYGDAMLIG